MIPLKAMGRLLAEAARQWRKDGASKLAAALAFYTLLSLTPALFIMMAVAGFAFGREAAQNEIIEQVRRVAGEAEAGTIEAILDSFTQPAFSNPAFTIIGIGALLLGATIVLADLQSSLNAIWKVAPRPERRLRTLFRKRFLPFLMVFSLGLFLAVSLGVSTAVSALTQLLGHRPSIPAYLLPFVNSLLSFAAITLLFAMIFKVLPDAHIMWSDVWIGAAVTSLLFTVGKSLIGFYLGISVLGPTYGKASSLVLFLLWVFLSAQIFFFGAEFTHLYAEKYGSRILPRGRIAASGSTDDADYAEAKR